MGSHHPFTTTTTTLLCSLRLTPQSLGPSQSDCRRWGSVRRDSGQETVTGSPPSREAPICQAGLEEGLAELSSHVHQFGGPAPQYPSLREFSFHSSDGDAE